MAFARSAAARTLQSSLRHSGRRAVPRLSAPARTQLVQRRFASGGHGEHQDGSDLPWLLGAIVVTIPSCYYLWPSSSHAEHHGDHGHDDHHTESQGEEKGGEEEPASEGSEDQGEEEKSEAESKDSGKEDASAESDKDFEEKQAKEQDAEPSKEKEGEVEEPTEKQEEEEKGEEKEKGDSTEPDMKADDSKRTVDAGQSRKIKKLPDSGQNIGITKDEEGQDKYHSGAKHALPIQNDPSKSKKGEGSPETAKMHNTVDPSRPAR